MRRRQRLIAACVLVAFSGVLGGCSSSSGFDPTDLLDFLDTKKKLPGDRKPVFPEGVPGLEQGVPKDLYKGAQQQQTDPNAQAAAAAPPAEPPKSKQAAKSKKSKQNASTTLTPADAAASGPEAAPEEDTTPAAPPAPPKKIARKRTTAPPPDQSDGQPAQQSQAPFPAPVPSGTFTR
jgi:hypothetical protein